MIHFSVEEKESRDKRYARIVALDLISCNAAANCLEIRRGLAAQNIEPLTSHTGVIAAVKREAAKVKKEIKAYLKAKKEEGTRFSATTGMVHGICEIKLKFYISIVSR